MKKSDVADQIISYLSKKHDTEVEEETELEDIGEDCSFNLMFELAKLFDADDRCDGDEIGDYASVWNCIDAVYDIL